MPGLMARLSLIFKSKFSKVLDRAENPNETLDYSYEEQLRQLQNVKRGIADVTTAKKRLEMQYTTMQQQVDKLDGQARKALEAGREDLAREALTRKAAAEAQLQGIMEQGQQLEAQQQKLIEGERALQTKVEAFRTQKEVIKAQYSAAEAQVRIGEAATGIGDQMADVGLAVQRAKDKTEQMQARANAIDELTAAGALEDFTSPGDDIDRQLAADLAGEPGRRPAREDEGRARPGLGAAEGARRRGGRQARMTREVDPRRASAGRAEGVGFRAARRDEARAGATARSLVRNVFVSVDPYMRSRMTGIRTYVGPFEVGERDRRRSGRPRRRRRGTPASRRATGSPRSSAGASRGSSTATALRKLDPSLAPPSTALGALGMPGFTAWIGLVDIGQVEEGETIYISGAAGAVGSTAAQIALLKGLRVIGSAGSPEKVEWLRSLGVEAFDYRRDAREGGARRTASTSTSTTSAATQLEAALTALRPFGRVIACGSISRYNDERPEPGPRNLAYIVTKRLRMQGFIVSDHGERYGDFLREVGPLGARRQARVPRDDRRGDRERAVGVRRALPRRQHRQDARPRRA